MTTYTVRALGLILACNARVHGMVAANKSREVSGDSMMYSEDQFQAEASEMEQIAMDVIQQ